MKQNISNINKFIIAITFCGFGFNSMSQEGVAINTNGAAADNSAILDITSTEKGLLLPRLTNAQREAITSPANGLLIYNIETHCLNYYNGIQWREWCGDCVDEDLY
ncbi:MAG: hypothetical protein KJ607_12535, partial [Bacteroidetes bacterium]|nr:hypothetical protein [Bacteroidota bacterium]